MFGLFKKYKVHMCSEVKGVLTLNGTPIKGALIKRNLQFAHKVNKEDQTPTSDDGTFYLPEVVIESKIPGDMFSHEITNQNITATYQGKVYDIWQSEVRGIDEPAEYKLKLGSLIGDLSSEKVDFTFTNDSNKHLEFYASSICRWDNDFNIYNTEEDDTDYFKDFD